MFWIKAEDQIFIRFLDHEKVFFIYIYQIPDWIQNHVFEKCYFWNQILGKKNIQIYIPTF